MFVNLAYDESPALAKIGFAAARRDDTLHILIATGANLADVDTEIRDVLTAEEYQAWRGATAQPLAG